MASASNASHRTYPEKEENMMKRLLIASSCIVALAGFLCSTSVPAEVPDKILIGEPATISGAHAKAGEQSTNGVEAIIDWVNNIYGGVKLGGKRVPLKYIKYDCESKKEAVTSLLERLITVDKVNFTLAPYTSGLTLAGAPVAEKYRMIYMDLQAGVQIHRADDRSRDALSPGDPRHDQEDGSYREKSRAGI
jgi:ABC-type branched-subunit amino acid transport system substrate-binding protein